MRVEIQRDNSGGRRGQVIQDIAAARRDGDDTVMRLKFQCIQIDTGILPDLVIDKPLKHKGKNPLQGAAGRGCWALMGSTFQEQIDHDHKPSANRT